MKGAGREAASEGRQAEAGQASAAQPRQVASERDRRAESESKRERERGERGREKWRGAQPKAKTKAKAKAEPSLQARATSTGPSPSPSPSLSRKLESEARGKEASQRATEDRDRTTITMTRRDDEGRSGEQGTSSPSLGPTSLFRFCPRTVQLHRGYYLMLSLAYWGPAVFVALIAQRHRKIACTK
ncbi:hypothetical protein AXG93_115s1930 [Marchantia polymorpha subsp. ruderalis]|uniref:Uncharacterized protein n=1 Tax=Marchantia polymorpha subsp. ruderalis TaxID=1480154 RepID=A0A176W7Q6_MARPO|nr:hypothetical protein AXG93_115s1930 [Marchantia polymorpha subsp. ruderalis]